MQAETGRSSTSPVGRGIKKAVPGEERLCAVSGNTETIPKSAIGNLKSFVVLSTPALGLFRAGLGLDKGRVMLARGLCCV